MKMVTSARYEDFQKWAGLPATRRGEEYDTLKKNIGRQLDSAAERYMPGLSQHLDDSSLYPPIQRALGQRSARRHVWAGTNSSPDGQGRLGACTSGVDGLFLAGAGAMRGCGGGRGIWPDRGQESSRISAERLKSQDVDAKMREWCLTPGWNGGIVTAAGLLG